MSNQEFTKIILDKLQDVLKPCGFRKRGSTFTKKVNDDVILVVNLQKSVSSSRDLVKATLNLGAFSLPLAHKLNQQGWGRSTMETPSPWDCHWQQRLGHVMPERRDKWWEVRDTGEAVRTGNEMAEAMVMFALPKLDTVADTARLQTLWQSGQSPGLTETERLRYLQSLGSIKFEEGSCHKPIEAP